MTEPNARAAIERFQQLADARPNGARIASANAYDRDVLAPAEAERNRIVLAAERGHAREVAKSAEMRSQAIGEAQGAYRRIAGDANWKTLLASVIAEVEARIEPYPDPQIQTLLAKGHLMHAAELLAGRRQIEASAHRDRAVARAEDEHNARIKASAVRFGISP